MHSIYNLWYVVKIIIIIQYLFHGPEKDVRIKPNGNAKTDKPFFRVSKSTQECISQVASTHKPMHAVNLLTNEQGGELEAKNLAHLPRDRQQISYARQKKTQILYTA